MRRLLPWFLLLLVGTVQLASLSADEAKQAGEARPTVTPDQEKFFEEKVRPLLAVHCWDCHGPVKQESELRLDSREAILAGGASGQKLVEPGKPEGSLLLNAVRRQGDYKMPPSERERLLPEQIVTLATWINLGLPWGNSPAPVPVSLEDRYDQARRRHWAFQPIRSSPLPAVHTTDWLANPIDAFVLARLEAAGLRPSPQADRRILIRRATMDLLGLLPTLDEVTEFIADPAPDAYERLVDRLLASPHYGERWGRHWLDVARYADTKGYVLNQEPNYPFAYTYRDYVTQALNGDLPYNQFLVEQLAADQLSRGDDNSSLAALGFLTVGRKYLNRNEDIDDQIDVVTRGMMGLTVACARCHDHKYDAIPTEDYYSLYGVFASCRQPNDLPLLGNPTEAKEFAEFQAELDKLKKEANDYAAQRHTAATQASREHVTDYLIRVVSNLPDNEFEQLPFLTLKGDDFKERIAERWRPFLTEKAKPDDPVLGAWRDLVKVPEDEFSQLAPMVLAKWSERPAGLEAGQVHPRVKAALESTPPATRIDVARIYGKLLEDAYAEWKKSGGGNSGRGPGRGPGRGSQRSLDRLPREVASLAQLLVAEDSPTNFTLEDTRVFFTRVDRNKHAELKRKADQFEARSPLAPPRAMVVADNSQLTNPRVLLRGNENRPGREVPRQFVRLVAGDDRKPFVKGSGRLELAEAIVAPSNPLTARVIVNRVWMHHFDAPLVSSPSDFGIRSDPPTHPELLDSLAARLRDGGWSIKDLHRQILLSQTYRQSSVDRPDCRQVDPENRLLWRMNRRRMEFEPLRDSLLAVAGRLDSTIGGRADDVTQPSFRRRALYGKIDRQDLPNLLRVFDIASPDQSSPGRSRTTVPQQALFLLNSPFAVEQAQQLARRTEVADGTPQRIEMLYGILFGRSPEQDEVELGSRFVESAQQDAAATVKFAAWEQYAHSLLLSNEFIFID